MNWSIYTILSLVFMLAIFGFAIFQIVQLIVSYVGGGRAEFKRKIRNYKYGKFLWVCLFAFPLFILSFVYSKMSPSDCIFKALTDSFKLLCLQFDFELELRTVDPVYNAAIISAYSVATCNVVMFIISCLNQIFWSWVGRVSFKHPRGKNRCLIIGNNLDNQSIYNSIDDSKTLKIIIDSLGKEQKWDLFAKNIRYISKNDNQKIKDFINKIITNFEKKIS